MSNTLGFDSTSQHFAQYARLCGSYSRFFLIFLATRQSSYIDTAMRPTGNDMISGNEIPLVAHHFLGGFFIDDSKTVLNQSVAPPINSFENQMSIPTIS